MSRVLITGVGTLSAAGVGQQALWDALLAPNVQLAEERLLPAPPGLPPLDPVQLAALPEVDAHAYLGRRKVRALSAESVAFGVATTLACQNAGLSGRWEADKRVGVAVGSTSAGLGEYTDLFAARLNGGVERVNPGRGPMTGLNAPAATVSIRSGAAGLNLTHSAGRTAAVDALADSARAVRSGTAQVMLAGGVQVLSYPELWARRTRQAAFGRVRTARPFDSERLGPVPGEAAVTLVLEAERAAVERGASVLGELLGAGSAFGTRAAVRAVGSALDEAGLAPGDVGAAVVSARGSGELDSHEAHAVRELWGQSLPVCAVAGALGDCAGAIGALQAAAALGTLGAARLPGTHGLRELDPQLPSLRVSAQPATPRAGCVLVLTVDPLGHAAALLIGGQPR